MYELSAQKLNALAADLGVKNLFFYAENAVKTVTGLAPYGKVAAIYSKNSFANVCKPFTERLKSAGVKAVNFILPDGARLDFKNASDVIGVPEDVRAVICFDRGLTDISAYIATLCSLPVIYIPRTIVTRGALAPKVAFFGDEFSSYTVKCPRHTVLDGEFLFDGGKAEQYINVVEKLLALTDYRVRHEIAGGRLAADAYSAVKNAVLSCFNVCNADDALLTLVTEGFKTEIADYSCGGDIICNSAAYNFRRLTGFSESDGLGFAFFSRALRVYAFSAGAQDHPFAVPDYNARALALAKICGADDGAFLKGLLRQTRQLKADRGELARIRAAFSAEPNLQARALKAIERNYVALGGKTDFDFSPYAEAFTLCGDLPNVLNFMTLAREGGFLED